MKYKMSIIDKIDTVEVDNDVREHLGASGIGNSCTRAVFYSFRWSGPSRINTKMNRTFRLGDACEQLIVDDLARVGIEVVGAQTFVSGVMGHFGGSIDGVIEGKLFEAKSMNDSNFKKYKKLDLEQFSLKYHYQINTYMGYLELPSTDYFVMNKNTSELDHREITFEPEVFDKIKTKAKTVILADGPDEFERIGTNISWFGCRYCDHRSVCHLGVEPTKTCRSCTHVKPCDNGLWVCTYHEKKLDRKEQLAACEDYRCEW